jgi:hypothetical protein
VAYGLLELVNETLGIDSDCREAYDWGRETAADANGIDASNIIAGTAAGRAKRATRSVAAARAPARGKGVPDSEDSQEEEEDVEEAFVE